MVADTSKIVRDGVCSFSATGNCTYLYSVRSAVASPCRPPCRSCPPPTHLPSLVAVIGTNNAHLDRSLPRLLLGLIARVHAVLLAARTLFASVTLAGPFRAFASNITARAVSHRPSSALMPPPAQSVHALTPHVPPRCPPMRDLLLICCGPVTVLSCQAGYFLRVNLAPRCFGQIEGGRGLQIEDSARLPALCTL